MSVLAWRRTSSVVDLRGSRVVQSASIREGVSATVFPATADIQELKRQIDDLKKQVSDERDIQLLSDIERALEVSAKRSVANSEEMERLRHQIDGLSAAYRVSFENYMRVVDEQLKQFRTEAKARGEAK